MGCDVTVSLLGNKEMNCLPRNSIVVGFPSPLPPPPLDTYYICQFIYTLTPPHFRRLFTYVQVSQAVKLVVYAIINLQNDLTRLLRFQFNLPSLLFLSHIPIHDDTASHVP